MPQEDQEARHRPGRGGARRRRRHTSGDTVVITSARRSRLADWRHRRHLYAGLQLARIPLFIAAVAIYGWLHNPVLAAFVAVISLPLPWIAVLLANDPGDTEPRGTPKIYKPGLVREQRARQMQALTDNGTAGRRSLTDGHTGSGDTGGHAVIDIVDDPPRKDGPEPVPETAPETVPGPGPASAAPEGTTTDHLEDRHA
ncbi:DUF3099 domain-containing protein [Corynebacterium provencense]|uniref:DUF3099 domain-containing protein n=1 Tax=Corynebacterium provencense TaxID=1737425 RepID=UPI00098EC470|nr:DUF3099 domain-containing protein [Corynebacterium provencense]